MFGVLHPLIGFQNEKSEKSSSSSSCECWGGLFRSGLEEGSDSEGAAFLTAFLRRTGGFRFSSGCCVSTGAEACDSLEVFRIEGCGPRDCLGWAAGSVGFCSDEEPTDVISAVTADVDFFACF